MIAHLLKIVWNRKSSNALIILEVFVSFLVVFAVAATSIYSWTNYHRPLGYDWRDVWHIQFGTGNPGSIDEEAIRDINTKVETLLRELESMAPVIRAAAGRYPPYSQSASTHSWTTSDEREMHTESIRATPEFPEVLGIEVVSGRWFEAADAALHWQPAVLSRGLARDLFGDADPLGKKIDYGELDEEDTEERIEVRVVGVIDDYRKGGELSAPKNMLFEAMWLDQPEQRASDLVVKLAPGTPAAFEEMLVDRLQAVAPEWSFSVRSLGAKRDTYLRQRLAPLFAAGVVAVFLIAMVALGLLGVLWQNVTQRTVEVGLRRAKGATRPAIHWQILGEMLTIATLGLVLGTLVVVQVPILGWFGFLDFGTYALAFAVSVLTIYLLSALCSLYPGWLAARIQPAEALQHE